MNSNSPKNNTKNKAKSIGMLTAIAGSCLLSTVLIQTSASAFIRLVPRFTKSLAQGTKIVNNPTFLSNSRKTDYRNTHQYSNSHVSNIKNILQNKATANITRPSINPGTSKVTQLVKNFSTPPTLTLKK